VQKIATALKLITLLVLLSLLVNACSTNKAPVIDKIIVGVEPVMTSSTSKLTCLATDPENEALTYTWSASQGAIEGQSRTATWQAPKEPGTYTIGVIVQDAKGNQSTSQLSVDVLDKTAPVINSLTAEPSAIGQGKSTVITCKAHDPQGDELIYRWEASVGQLTEEGSTVTWLAQTNRTTGTIKVVVTDKHGNSSSKSLDINVIPNHNPTVKSLVSDPQKVVGGKTSTITCQATDEDGDALQYEWKVTAGEFTGGGNVIVWTAPTDCQQATVSVKVSDGRGEQVSKSLNITVAKEGG
jgi:hypothetical protein